LCVQRSYKNKSEKTSNLNHFNEVHHTVREVMKRTLKQAQKESLLGGQNQHSSLEKKECNLIEDHEIAIGAGFSFSFG
jgi:hypothetical protein